jgi:hypothetical protein
LFLSNIDISSLIHGNFPPFLKKSTYVFAYTIRESSVSRKENLLGNFWETNSCVRVLGCGPKLAFQNGEVTMASSLDIYASIAMILDELSACTP